MEATLVSDIIIVKDVWTVENTSSEGEILADIIGKISKIHPIADLEPETIPDLVAKTLCPDYPR